MTNLLPLPKRLTDIRLIATDIDGTLTSAGKFSSELLESIDLLNTNGIELLLVTGRSAGWVSAVNNYLPVVGSIAHTCIIRTITNSNDLCPLKFWKIFLKYLQNRVSFLLPLGLDVALNRTKCKAITSRLALVSNLI